jgi:hypothetical protein
MRRVRVRRKLSQHRLGIAPALGLRAPSSGPIMVSQTAFADKAHRNALSQSEGRIMSRTNERRGIVDHVVSARRRPTANCQRSRQRRLFEPRIEALESRTLLSTLIVTSPTDDGLGSLRAAVAAAQSGDQIVFGPSMEGQTITLTSGELAITKDLDIEGLGANLLAVNANHASRVFDISGGATVTIAGLTITDGLAAGGPGSGGGIENIGSQLTIANDAFSNNEARGTTGNGNGRGGAIDNTAGATLTVRHCLFLQNQATASNAALAGAIYTGNATATVVDTTFIGNQSIGGSGGNGSGFSRGGGIYNTQGFLTVVNGTFVGNQAIAGSDNTGGEVTGSAIGGGIANTDAAIASIAGSSFTDNQAIGGSNNTGTGGIFIGSALGGAMFNAGVATVTENTFVGNEARGGDGNNGSGTAFEAGVAIGGAVCTIPGNNSAHHASLIGSHLTLRDNKAIGGAGNSAATFMGIGFGGGLASDGGGIANPSPGSTTTLRDSTVADNQAVGGQANAGDTCGDGRGGGMANLFGGVLTVSDGTFTDNQAVGSAAGADGNGSSGFGGGLYNDGVSAHPYSLGAPTILTLLDSTFLHNEARGGAAAGVGTSAGRGAGGGIANAGLLTVLGSRLALNLARGGDGQDGANGGDGLGGGLYVADGTASVLDTAIGHSHVTGGDGANGGNGFGGGVYVASGTVIVSASAITHNRARGGNGSDGGTDGLGMGGGVYNLGTILFDAATVIAHNHASTSNDDCFGCWHS